MKALLLFLPLLMLFPAGQAAGQSDPAPLEQRRAQAQQSFTDGNWKEALAVYRETLKDPSLKGKDLSDDFTKARQAQANLNQFTELDALIQSTVATHPDDWRLLFAASHAYREAQNYGFMIDGKFQRAARGSGKMVSSAERDRVLAEQYLQRAMLLVASPETAASVEDRVAVYSAMFTTLSQREPWKLQALTDLQILPDYEDQRGRRGHYPFGSPYSSGAPVHEDGSPVFYQIPASWQDAKSDGERLRWVQQQWASLGAAIEADASLRWAQFLSRQFDVQTLTGRWTSPDDRDAGDQQLSTFSLGTLTDEETIAYLATGAKRFKLPADQNFLAIYKRIGEQKEDRNLAFQALSNLAASYVQRQQRDRAADVWKQAIALDVNSEYAQRQYEQITGNWGAFTYSVVQPSGTGAKVGFDFRNGKKVKLKARRVDFTTLLADVKKYLATNPVDLDWEKVDVRQIGYRILEESHAKYVKEEVAQWELPLEPLERHLNRRIDITTPLQSSGAYLLEAQMEDGNRTAILVWLSDTAIVKKYGGTEQQFFVVDAVTGQPVAKANLEFFGYQQKWLNERQQRGKRRANITTRNFAEETDAQGQFFSTERQVTNDHQWLITATTPEGRFAFLGWTGAWYSAMSPDHFQQIKIYTITDRPVYQPKQTVKFKSWIRRAAYDAPDTAGDYAHQKFRVRIRDGRQQQVYDQTLEADAYAGIQAELALPEDAALGNYTITVSPLQGPGFSQQGSFRVEEYKKPEYEVKVDAPSTPISLGDKVTAKVTAKYYFGAPVTKAKVKYKVQRSAHQARWYPVRPWDWFYGPGYWWFGYDYDWYPGFATWGCRAPIWWWWNRPSDPPELVLDSEAEIGADGTLLIDIDTSLAKAMHGDDDHRYEITVEVTDESRRTILGSGTVLVAREPFKVNLWTDRGHYEAGQPVEVGIKAQSLDQKGIKGKGTLSVLKISYGEDDQPIEKQAFQQDFTTNDDGSAQVKFSAAEAGQYRLSAKVTDAQGRTKEGGYIFTVRGPEAQGKDFRFAALELVPDKAEYAPGETIKLMVNTAHADSTVYFFTRTHGNQAPRPQVLKLQGRSQLVEIAVEAGDMPNFFIDAFSVSDGKVNTATREIAVPPAKRILSMEVLPQQNKFKPQDKAKVQIKLTDEDGKPYVGNTVVTVYDKSLEYISGGSNVPEIKAYFWKWRRYYRQHMIENNLGDQFPNNNVPRNSPGMDYLNSQLGYGLGIDSGGGIAFDSGAYAGLNEPRMMRTQSAMPAAAPAPAAEAAADGLALSKSATTSGSTSSAENAPPTPPVMIRSDFADAIYWTASLNTNAEGIAEIEVPLPDNLTTWKIRSWGMGNGTRVGEATAEIITSKDLILRQQAPRFFVQKDEVTLSANVHNYLPDQKEVKVTLELDGGTLAALEGQSLTQTITVPSQGEQRVDWRVKTTQEGTATIRMKAITDADSDAMEMKYPVYVHGMLKTESFSGVIRPEEAAGKIELTVPQERRPEQSRLEIRYSPSIATAILDALPYLVDYPYGCTEQTLNRFLPAAQAHKALRDMGVDLAAIQKKRTNLNPQEIGQDQERAAQWQRYQKDPVFNAEEHRSIVKFGVEKLTSMQNSDGGWGWFSGEREQSYPHTTAVVVHGLQAAKDAGVVLIPGVLERGLTWLKNYEKQEVTKLNNSPQKTEPYKLKADAIDALVFYVLAEGKSQNAAMRDFLYRDRNDLTVYAKCAFAIGLDIHGEKEKRDMLRQNIEQFLVMDDSNQTARLDVRNGGFWWYWYGSEIEANAFYLKLLSRIDPRGKQASGVVKFLLNNRKNATYWNSTRDTAYCVEAFTDYLKATQEGSPDMLVEILVDGVVRKEVSINKDNLFSYDNRLILEGEAITSGKHTVEIRRKGVGPLYYNAYLTNFTLEDRITKAGLEVQIERRYYKLTERKNAAAQVSGARGQVVDQKVLKYDRTPIQDGAELKSGDLVEVELLIESKNDYEYLLFEDMKPAGLEAVEVRSGYDYGSTLPVYREFRNERVAIFARSLPLGRHSLTYRLKAEIPGKFSALPAKASAMYAPELRGNSDEFKLGVRD